VCVWGGIRGIVQHFVNNKVMSVLLKLVY